MLTCPPPKLGHVTWLDPQHGREALRMISQEALTTGSPFLCTEGTREDSRNATQKINQLFSESSETKALGLWSGGAGIRVSKCWVESLSHPGCPLAQGPACRGDMGRRERGLLQC